MEQSVAALESSTTVVFKRPLNTARLTRNLNGPQMRCCYSAQSLSPNATNDSAVWHCDTQTPVGVIRSRFPVSPPADRRWQS